MSTVRKKIIPTLLTSAAAAPTNNAFKQAAEKKKSIRYGSRFNRIALWCIR